MAKAVLVASVAIVVVAFLSAATVMGADGDDGQPTKQWKPMKQVDVTCASNADCGGAGM